MKRYTLFATLVAAAIALVVVPRMAPAAQELPFMADSELTYVETDGKYDVYLGTGTSSTVGKFTAECDVHFPGWKKVVGLMTITVANGDSLYLQFEQDSVARGLSVGPYMIIGGTGRFAQASGSGTITTTVLSWDPVPSVDVSLEGTIKY